MHTSGLRITAALVITAASGLVATASPAQAAVPDYKYCDLYNSSADHLTAYCDKPAAGTEYRVKIRCSDGKVYYGPWRKQSGTYSSTRYCPGGISITGGDRQLR